MWKHYQTLLVKIIDCSVRRFIQRLSTEEDKMVRKGKEVAPAAVEEHPGGGHISVSVQQSRYALDAVDAPASKEVCTHKR